MPDEIEQSSIVPLTEELRTKKRGISRRKMLIWLAAIVAAEGVASGMTWQKFLLGLQATLESTNLPAGSLRLTYKSPFIVVQSETWSPDSTRIAFISGKFDSTGNPVDSTLHVWDASSDKILFSYGGSSAPVQSETWSPDSTRIAFVSGKVDSTGNPVDSTLHVWDASSDKILFSYHGPSASYPYADWSPDSTHIAFISGKVDSSTGNYVDSTLHVWDARSGKVLFSYGASSAPVQSETWSPDGTRLAFISGKVNSSTGNYVDSTLHVWDVSSDKVLFSNHGPSASYPYADWSPDSTRIAFVDSTLHVWDARSGKVLFSYGASSAPVQSETWSPDGTRLAFVSGNTFPSTGNSVDSTLHVWDASSDKILFSYHGPSASYPYADWSPDSTRIAFVSGNTFPSTGNPVDSTLHVLDVNSSKVLFSYGASSAPVQSETWSPDSRRIAFISGTFTNFQNNIFSTNSNLSFIQYSLDSTLHVLDVNSSKVLFSYGGSSAPVQSETWSPDSTRIAFVSGIFDPTTAIFVNSLLQVRDATNGETLLTIQDHSTQFVEWSRDNKHLASTSTYGIMQVWDATSGKGIFAYGAPPLTIESLAWSPDGTHIASGIMYGAVHIWDATSGKTLFIYNGHSAAVQSVAWSPDGTHIASGSADTTVRIWDTTTGKTLFTCSGHSAAVQSVAWSPDGTHIASGSADTTVRIWDTTTGKTLFTCSGHSAAVQSVTWSPDGTHIASGSADTTVRIWDATTGKLLLTYGGPAPVQSVAWSPDGAHIASGITFGIVRILDVNTGRTLLTDGGHSAVQSVTWSPDGAHIASGSADTTVRIWDATTGKLLLTYGGHSAIVQSVAWSPNGTYIASGSLDKTVQIWRAL